MLTHLELKPFFGVSLEMISEERNFLVINKPAGLLSHPTKAEKNGTLVNVLLASYPEIKRVGDDSARPGIVHRLDKDASGLLVIAKTQKAFEHLKSQFQKHQILKEYLVLVYGCPKHPKGSINFPIARSKKPPFKMVVLTRPAHPRQKLTEEKEALSEYEIKEKFKDFTLLKIRTKTGRTHQIRAHLAAIGCPVAGEKVYKSKRLKPVLPRLFLHASRLGFNDLAGKWQEFKSELPEELKIFLDNIR